MLSRIFRLACVFPLGLLLAQPAPDAPATARKALDLFLGNKYSDLAPMLSPRLKTTLTEPVLDKMVKSWGPAEKIGEPTTQSLGPNSLVVIPVQFAKESINFQIVISPTGEVAQIIPRAAEVPWQRPAYVKPESFRAREVFVGDDEWKLPGTLTVPAAAGKFPAIVLAPDSGPADRDETVYTTKVFRDIAEGLSSRGIVVLRYEKRTKQYSARMTGSSYTIDEEIVDDAERAAALLRAQPEVDPKRVYLLGFGVGGYIGPRTMENDGKFAGLIILGGNSRPIEDLFVDEAAYMQVGQKQLDLIKMQATKVKNLDPADSAAPALFNLPVSYWIDLKTYDAPATAKKLNVPILVLQGARDFQVTQKDFDGWKAALGSRKDVTFKSYPALNHLFVAGTGPSTEPEYRKPGGHVAPEVVEDIAKFAAS